MISTKKIFMNVHFMGLKLYDLYKNITRLYYSSIFEMYYQIFMKIKLYENVVKAPDCNVIFSTKIRE